MPTTTSLMHADLIVADAFTQNVFLRDVDLNPGRLTDWTIYDGPGTLQVRALQNAIDGGWAVTQGSSWHAETTEQFGDGQTIRIERMNTVET